MAQQKKKTTTKKPVKKKSTKKQVVVNKQLSAIILFAVSILFFFIPSSLPFLSAELISLALSDSHKSLISAKYLASSLDVKYLIINFHIKSFS